MSGLFGLMLGLSLAGGATCLVVFATGLLVNNRLRKSWLFYIWLIVLLRFLIPVPLSLPYISDGIGNLTAALSSAITAPEVIPSNLETGDTASNAFNNEPTPSAVNQKPSTALTDNADNTMSPNTVIDSTAPASLELSPRQESANGVGILSMLPYVWLTGIAGALIWTVAGYIITVLKLQKDRILLTSGRVPIYESGHITTPVLVGVIRPTIYLPRCFPNPDLAVRHELTHLRRGDIWLKWLLQLTVCVHWFNPLAWLMKRELNRCIELACDSAVVRKLEHTARLGYGQMLLDAAKTVSKQNGALIASLGRDKRLLTERLSEIISIKRTTKKTVAAMSALAVIILSCAVVFGAVFSGCSNSPGLSATAPDSPDTSAAAPSGNPISAICIISNFGPPLENDPAVIGTWQLADIVQSISAFEPTKPQYTGSFYKWELNFLENSTLGGLTATYTLRADYAQIPGVSDYPFLKPDSTYEIRTIDGAAYMFVGNKNTDNSINYVVWKKISDTTFTSIRPANEPFDTAAAPSNSDIVTGIYCSVVLPFDNDTAVVGTWQLADIVQSISSFEPGKPQYTGDFYKSELINRHILPEGYELILGVSDYPFLKSDSTYEIKTIGGAAYMFVEDKNTDDSTNYVVWKKISDTAITSSIPVNPSVNPDTFVTNLTKNGAGLVRSVPASQFKMTSPISTIDVFDIRSLDCPKYLNDDQMQKLLNELPNITFNSDTVWPEKMPSDFNPAAIMESGKNPGLGVKGLHEAGITGQGISIAIIDQTLYTAHPEYKDNLALYEEIHVWPNEQAAMHGSAVSSIAVGKTCGVAPDAKLYYWAVNLFKGQDVGSAADKYVAFADGLAAAVDRMLEVNAKLPEGEKIRVLSISRGFSDLEDEGVKTFLEAVERAKAAGIFVITTSTYAYSDFMTPFTDFGGLGKVDVYGDPDSLATYTLGGWQQSYALSSKDRLLVPMDARTTADFTGADDYVFYSSGGWSWVAPYLAGLYALSAQVKPDISPEVFWTTALDTANQMTVTLDTISGANTYTFTHVINPPALIDALR